MMNADLKRNASGYYDETCYKGITAPPKPGEIWQNKKGQRVLIINSNAKVASTLLLTTNTETAECPIPVTAGDKVLYTDPIMIGYALVRTLDAFVMKAKPEEFHVAREEIGKALGITNEDKVKALAERVAVLIDKNDALNHENADLRRDLKDAEEMIDALKLKRESDKEFCMGMSAQIEKANVYRELYTELIDKLVSVRGGCRCQ